MRCVQPYKAKPFERGFDASERKCCGVVWQVATLARRPCIFLSDDHQSVRQGTLDGHYQIYRQVVHCYEDQGSQ